MAKKDRGLIEHMRDEIRVCLNDRYENMAYAVFDWKGIPKEVPRRYPERWLYNQGLCTMFVPKGWDTPVCLQVATGSVMKNLYGEPTEWRATAPAFVDGVTNVTLNNDNAVLIRNGLTYRPTAPFVRAMVDQMVNVEMTLRMNLNAQKVAYIFESSNGMEGLQQKQDFIDLMEGNSFFARNNMGGDVFKVWSANVPFHGKDFSELFDEYEKRVLSYIGAYERPFEKKERLVTGEVESLNDMLDIQLKGRLEERRIACERFNELFGYDISVDLSHDTFDSESERDDSWNSGQDGEPETE